MSTYHDAYVTKKKTHSVTHQFLSLSYANWLFDWVIKVLPIGIVKHAWAEDPQVLPVVKLSMPHNF